MYEKVAAADAKKSSSKKRLSPLTGPEQRRLDELEEELPLQAIVMFRAMARKEVRSRLLFLLLLLLQLLSSSPRSCPNCCYCSSVTRLFPDRLFNPRLCSFHLSCNERNKIERTATQRTNAYVLPLFLSLALSPSVPPSHKRAETAAAQASRRKGEVWAAGGRRGRQKGGRRGLVG